MSKKVLIVEDSPTELRFVRAALDGQGYELAHVGDGESALERVATDRPDLIVLDVVLPKANGYQVCRQLKMAPETRGIKILLLTSKSQESDRFWGLKQGADEYLTKPFDPEQLAAAVQLT